MRIWKMLPATLFVVLAFAAGICFNSFFGRTTVLGAPSSRIHDDDDDLRRGRPLTSVAHNATLTGTGTTTSPLGVATNGIGTGRIANGAVTLSKLSVSGSPAIGSILGFTGSGLGWQAPNSGSGGAQVVDSVGHSYPLQTVAAPLMATLVQNPVTPYGALYQTAGETFVIPILANNIVETGASFFYVSSDCSGNPLLLTKIDPSSLLVQQIQSFDGTAAIVNTTLYYATGAPQQISVNSEKFPGESCSQAAGVQSVSSVGSLDLSSAFVPPFHVALN